MSDLDQAIARDRQAIDSWNRDLPGYLNSFDEWLELDKEAQKASVARGLNLAAVLFLTDLQAKLRTRGDLKQQELDEIWRRLRESPLNSPEFKALLTQNGILVKDLRAANGQADFVRLLEDAILVTRGAYSASHAHYAAAAVELLGLALHDPRARVLVAEVDFAISAVYANLADRLARKNIENLLQLGDKRLQAINSLSAVMSRHVNERKELKRRRQKILSDA
jgi:hypothetical protein